MKYNLKNSSKKYIKILITLSKNYKPIINFIKILKYYYIKYLIKKINKK